MTDTNERPTIEIVGDILERELGERWGDGYVVTDVICGYAEPGYGGDDTIVVLGNWNNKRWINSHLIGPQLPLTDDESLPSRLAEMLDEIDGVEIEWLDEWISCSECYRAVRTEPDSYSWQPYYSWVHECGFVCSDCMMKDPGAYIDDGDWTNSTSNAITWITGRLEDTLEPLGFVHWEPGNPQHYANGWYPGQTDDPKKILEAILDRHPDAEVVFTIDSVGQFDCHFSAWVRGIDDETDDDNEED